MFKRIKKRANRLISLLISVLICLTVIPPLSIKADNGIFDYSDYTVEYNIVNEWEGNQNIEIKLTNTGSEPIYNWALKYNAGGTVEGAWNCAIFDYSGTDYIIKNAGYNYEILPGESVTFGYTLTGSNLTAPSGFENCAERVEIKDKYNAQLVITDKWESGFTGYIDIENISDIPLEAWKLSFDTNFKIDNYWNADIAENSEYSYTASSKIMSNPIQPNTSVQVGISASFENGVDPMLSNVIMSAVQIKNDLADSGNNNGNIIDDSDENVGRIFFKDLSSKDDLIYDSEGNCYFKNQILLTAYNGVTYEKVSAFADSINAGIVGYIELTNDYQIEFNYDMTVEELFGKIEEISQNSVIEYVSPNIVSEVECDSFPNDTQIQPENGNEITEKNKSLFAINMPEAWETYGNISLTYPTKIGVIDYMFTNHNDLYFKKIWNNPKVIKDGHGTLVAGIIGADYNNNYGIAGICPKAIMYGFSLNGDDTPISSYSTIMKIKYALALLIGNGTKVINVSMGYEDDLENGTEIVDRFLNKLLDLEYDFVIVNSAGNNGGESDFEHYDARKHSYFTNIPLTSQAYAHIIVVGAVNVNQYSEELEYEFRESSSYGTRVDILAPGDNIISTNKNIKFFDYIHETSAAAPQVAGVAGLLYSIDPGLSGERVKEIIVESAKKSAENDPKRNIVCDKGSGKKYEYPLLDAKAAVDFAIAFNGPFQPELEKDEAIVYGTVTDENDNIVPNAKIKITSSDGKTYEETADEKGLYTFTLPFGTYDIKFYTGEEPALKNLFFVKDYQYHLVKDKKIGKDFWDGTVIAYPLDVKLDNIKTKSVGIFDSNGQDLSQISVSVKKEGNDGEYSTIVNSDGLIYGEPEDGSYTIVISKAGYTSRTITAEAKDGKLYAENGELLEKILLNPVSITVKGKVSEHNKTTNITKPLVGYTVTAVSKDNPGYAVKGTTNALGEYEISLGNAGDYTVIFTDKLQYDFYADNGEYFFDAVIEVEDDDDGSGGDKGDSGNGGNTGGGSENDPPKDWETEVTEENSIVISTEVDDPSKDNDNTKTGGDFGVDLKQGIYIDCGEYTCRVYVEDYEYSSSEIWTAYITNKLKYDIYKNGVLISSYFTHFWYKRVVSSFDYTTWIYTEYVSSVGVKTVRENGRNNIYLTYTIKNVHNPVRGEPDSVFERNILMISGSDAVPTVRNH